MIRKLFIILLLCFIVISGVSCSVSFPGKKPESGFWYCEELRTGIDFDLYQTTNYCVIVYYDDGSVRFNGCHFDYGNGVHFFTDLDGEEYGYFYGEFKYHKKQKQFTITTRSDGITYTFVEREKR